MRNKMNRWIRKIRLWVAFQLIMLAIRVSPGIEE